MYFPVTLTPMTFFLGILKLYKEVAVAYIVSDDLNANDLFSRDPQAIQKSDYIFSNDLNANDLFSMHP